MSTSIIKTDTYAPVATGEHAFEPASISEAMRLAGLLVASRLLPKAVTTPEAAFVIMATGRELGLTTMQSFRSIHVIDGKPSLSADLLLGMIKQKRALCSYFMLVESTDEVARYRTHRVGEPEATEMQFSIVDAKRAGLLDKDNWRKYPASMLRARCIAALSRAVYPDLAMGLYDPDELSGDAKAPNIPALIRFSSTDDIAPASEREQELNAIAFCESIGKLIDASESKAELAEVIASIRSARTRGVIDDAHVTQLRARWGSRNDVIRASEASAEGPSEAAQ